MNEHVERLTGRHSIVDEALRQEMKRPAPDSIAVRTLKKLKLRLKDKIEAILTGTDRRDRQLQVGRSRHLLKAAFSRNNNLHQADPHFPYEKRC